MTFIQNRSTLTSGKMTTHTMNLHMSILLHKKRVNSNAVEEKMTEQRKRGKRCELKKSVTAT